MDIGSGNLKNTVWHNVWHPLWNTATSRHEIGTNVFDRDWDVLVVLDACRSDSLRMCSQSFEWLNNVDTIQSVGSMSAEWVLKTFTKKYLSQIENTALISRNVWSQRIFDEELYKGESRLEGDELSQLRPGWPNWTTVSSNHFAHYERVQPIGNQDNRIHPESTSIPHIVTDRAISVKRELDPDRLIVWYRMPHLNFIADAIEWSEDTPSVDTVMSGPEVVRDLRPEEKSYQPVKGGEVTREKMFELYNNNLEFVLKYVDILINNIDAETVVISSDHGEGLGDGWLKIWGHPYGFPFHPIKTVPWATTTATDEQTYEPRFEQLDRNTETADQREFLKDMGYI